MSTPHYSPLTQFEIDFITQLSVTSWHGPALPRPDGDAGLDLILDTLSRLLTRAQNLIQAKDALSIEYTLQGITATAERFMLGTEEQVQEAAQLRSLVTFAEAFLGKSFTKPEHQNLLAQTMTDIRTKLHAPLHSLGAAVGGAGGVVSAQNTLLDSLLTVDPNDYAYFSLEDPTQFSMAWTTFLDGFRNGYPHVPQYAAAVTDPVEATRQFWPMLRSTALPYNLFVLQRLEPDTALDYKTNFGTSWQFDDLLAARRLYGIDMTVFNGLSPQDAGSGTVRFTPSTMVLLEMDAAKTLTPIAVYVADPLNAENSQVYTQASPAWIYALMAVKTSLTVYGIWLGHVYTLHIVTAAMQMATLNALPGTNIIYQMLAPQSKYTIPFDLLLMLGWSNLSPPTSISSSGKFLTLCNTFTATHDFFSMDPASMLARMNLDPADFTDPSIDDKPWNLYPNVQLIHKIWGFTSDYVNAVVDAGYPDDASVANDADLQAWITEASGHGNVVGLPRLDSKAALKAVVTSVLYRITFHGMGRLRNVGTPEPVFAPNYPPCLQLDTIPDPAAPLSTADLLKYLPNTGTLGKLVSFYYIFSYNAPYEPVVPNKGSDDELFFDQATHPSANQALIDFRNNIANFIRWYQPDWVQIGQWPRNIEL